MKVLLLTLIATGPIFTGCQYGGGEEPYSPHPPNTGGGEQPYSPHLTDPEVIFAVEGINEFYRNHGDTRLRTATQIVSAMKQAVDGMMYILTIEVSGGDVDKLCKVAVWSREWLKESPNQISEPITCAPKKSEIHTEPRGENILDQKDSNVQSLFKFLERSVNDKSESSYYLKPISAIKVTEQDITGTINYRVYDLGFSESSCKKTTVRENPNTLCTVEEGEIIDTCSFQVSWNRRETPEYKIINEKCE